jgi:hypothetical protein
MQDASKRALQGSVLQAGECPRARRFSWRNTRSVSVGLDGSACVAHLAVIDYFKLSSRALDVSGGARWTMLVPRATEYHSTSTMDPRDSINLLEYHYQLQI